LEVPVDYVTCHPTQDGHTRLWQSRGYVVRPEPSCEWTDGEIGGYCCEIFVGSLEIGNLVNPLGHSTDVGFGWERLHQIVEGKTRVDETCLFIPHSSPVVRDHVRTLEVLWRSGIIPGGKGRNFVCRRLLRRLLDLVTEQDVFVFEPWLEQERQLRDDRLGKAKRCWKKFKDRSPDFWKETFGIMPEEIMMLASE